MSTTGTVGEASFTEALKVLKRGSKRLTLFVHDGRSEKVIHFSRSRVLVLLPRPAEGGDPRSESLQRLCSQDALHAAGGGDPAASENPDGDPAYREAAIAYLQGELNAICSWQGALFELREGAFPPQLISSEQFLSIRCSSSTVLQSWNPPGEDGGGEAGHALFQDLEFGPRLEALSGALQTSISKHLLQRELAYLWEQMGFPSRAAQSFRDIARHYVEWGDEEKALQFLERAIDVCPLDLVAAEEAILLYQAGARQSGCDAIAEKVFPQLERLKQYDAIKSLYDLLQRVPSSPEVRRVAGEVLLRAGETTAAFREFYAVADSWMKSGERGRAAKLYRRILETDAQQERARKALARIETLQLVRRQAIRWGGLAASLLLVAAWFCWDVASASAFQKVHNMGAHAEPRTSVGLLKSEAGRFPLTRYASRLAQWEEDLFRQAFAAERELVVEALKAQRSGDLSQADDLFKQISDRGLVPVLVNRARFGRVEIREEQERLTSLYHKAEEYKRERNYEAAFGVYKELLEGANRQMFAAGYTVPVLVETVPPGASIQITKQVAGTSPRWIAMPSDSDTVLRLNLDGFEAVLVHDPLGRVLEGDTPRLTVSLQRPASWRVRTTGGVFAAGSSVQGDIRPVLCADGVLRGLDLVRGTVRWETPLTTVSRKTPAPLLAGPAVLSTGESGSLSAFSLKTGRWAWTVNMARKATRVHLGPLYAGQVLAVADGRAILLNPLTGLLVRTLHLGRERAAGLGAVSGDVGYFALEGGGLAMTDLGTGKHLATRWRGIKGPRAIVARRRAIVVLSREGELASLDAGKDAVLWKTSLGPEFQYLCSSVNAGVCAGSRSGKVYCMDAGTGDRRWNAEFDGELIRLSCPGSDGRVLFAWIRRNERLFLTKVSAADGMTRLEVDTGTGEIASVRSDGDLVLVSSPSFGVVAYPRLDP